MKPLEQLRDIHQPPPVDWWPPAPGWWFLGLLVLALGLWGAVRLYRRARRGYRRRQYRREALGELARLCQRHRDLYLKDLLTLVRRTAISAETNREFASETSRNLLIDLLNVSGNDGMETEALISELYRPQPQPLAEPTRSALCQSVATWIRQQDQAPRC